MFPSLWSQVPSHLLVLYPFRGLTRSPITGTVQSPVPCPAWDLPQSGQDRGYPRDRTAGIPQDRTGSTLHGTGQDRRYPLPPDRRVSDATPLAIRLLRSSRRTFCVSYFQNELKTWYPKQCNDSYCHLSPRIIFFIGMGEKITCYK